MRIIMHNALGTLDQREIFLCELKFCRCLPVKGGHIGLRRMKLPTMVAGMPLQLLRPVDDLRRRGHRKPGRGLEIKKPLAHRTYGGLVENLLLYPLADQRAHGSGLDTFFSPEINEAVRLPHRFIGVVKFTKWMVRIATGLIGKPEMRLPNDRVRPARLARLNDLRPTLSA